MSHGLAVPAAVALALVASAASGLATSPDAACRADLSVRLVLVPPVPGADQRLSAMRQEAEALWRPYGVALTWLTAGTDDGRAGPEPSLYVMFAHHAHPGSGRDLPGSSGLGAIRFDAGGVPGDVITLSIDDIAATVLSLQVLGYDVDSAPPALKDGLTGRATGRVLAHEIGHYLLALRTHTQEGLMRPSFRGQELADRDRQGFRLNPLACLRLRRRLEELTAVSAHELTQTVSAR